MFRVTQTLRSRTMLILSEAEVRQCFPVSAAIECNRNALSSLRKDGEGGAMVPSRIGLPYNPGDASSSPSTDWSLFKPAAYYPPSNTNVRKDNIVMGMKVVSVRANNPAMGKPTVPATVMLLNPETGEVSTIMAATYLTAARTAAGSAVSTELALKNNPKNNLTLVVFGAGLQAELHIKSIRHVVKVKEVIIINRTSERAEKLKEDLLQEDNEQQASGISIIMLSDQELVQNAVHNADIIVTCTNTCEPLFDGQHVKPGCHINGVGSFTPQMKEVDDTLVQRCEVIIDTPEALDVGDLSWLKANMTKVPNYAGLIGDALSSNFDFGKLRDDPGTPQIDCTFFKSCGTAIQDVVSAQYVSDQALAMKIGKNVEM